jgi:hypothetical protein
LVRAKHDRATREEINLFDAVRHGPVQSPLRINLFSSVTRLLRAPNLAAKQAAASDLLVWRR